MRGNEMWRETLIIWSVFWTLQVVACWRLSVEELALEGELRTESALSWPEEEAKEMCAIEARSRLLLKEQPTGVKVVKTGDLPSPERHGGTVACHRQRPNGVST